MSRKRLWACYALALLLTACQTTNPMPAVVSDTNQKQNSTGDLNSPQPVIPSSMPAAVMPSSTVPAQPSALPVSAEPSLAPAVASRILKLSSQYLYGGMTFTVTGEALQRISSVTLMDQPLTLKIISDTALQLQLPELDISPQQLQITFFTLSGEQQRLSIWYAGLDRTNGGGGGSGGSGGGGGGGGGGSGGGETSVSINANFSAPTLAS